MQILRLLIRVDLLADPLAAAICVAISYYAYKAHQFSQQRNFLLMHYAFIVLATGFATHFISIVFGAAILEAGFRREILRVLASNVTFFGGWLYVVFTLTGYLLLVAAYASPASPRAEEAAVLLQIPFLLQPLYGPFFDAIIFVLALAVFVEVSSRHLEVKSTDSFLVTIAFLLLALSRLLLLFTAVENSFYALGQFMQLAGFLVFLATIARIGQR